MIRLGFKPAHDLIKEKGAKIHFVHSSLVLEESQTSLEDMPGMLLTALMYIKIKHSQLSRRWKLCSIFSTLISLKPRASRSSMVIHELTTADLMELNSIMILMEDSRHNWLFELLKVRSHEVTGLNQFHLLKRLGTEHTAQQITHC